MAIDIHPGIYKKFALSVGGIAILLISAFIMGDLSASGGNYGFLSLVMVFGLFGAFLIYVRPTVGFALMLFLIPFGSLTRLTGKSGSLELLVGILLLGIYSTRVLILHEKIKFDRVSLFACAFVAWGIITSVWSVSPGASIKFAIFRLGQMVAMYVLILNYCRSQRQLNIITLSFCAGALVAATASIFLGTTEANTQRLTFFSDSNYFALTSSLAMIIMLYCFYKMRSKLLRAVIVLGTIIIGYVIIRAQSRGVWISVPASFLICSILLHRNSKIVKYSTAIIVMMVVFITSAYYLGFIDEAVISRFKTLTSGNVAQATARRNVAWMTGLEMIKNNPLLGIGLSGFKYVYKDYAPSFAKTTDYEESRARGAHNTFIAVFAETGLVGFIIFCSIFIYLSKGIWHIKDPVIRFIFMWLFTCLILGSSTLVTYNVPWFWIVLLLIALRAKFEKQTYQLITPKNYSYIPG